ncbi:MAG: hypothetical protein AAGH79_06375 [Bacteroidota bacterium]
MAAFVRKEEHLKVEWDQAWASCGVAPERLVPHWSFLVKKYTGVGRAYHNLRHLEQMFMALEDFHIPADRPLLALAILYHDVIYVVHRRDNEDRSADLAERHLLEAGVSPSVAGRTAHLIQLTKNHQLAGSKDHLAPILLDVDLGILGSPWTIYEQYMQQIRREYRIYPTVLYRRGRVQALQHLLRGERLFHSPAYIDRFEERARENIAREIQFWQG